MTRSSKLCRHSNFPERDDATPLRMRVTNSARGPFPFFTGWLKFNRLAVGTCSEGKRAARIESLELEPVLKAFENNEQAAELAKAVEQMSVILPARRHATEMFQPTDGPFHFPAV